MRGLVVKKFSNEKKIIENYAYIAYRKKKNKKNEKKYIFVFTAF